MLRAWYNPRMQGGMTPFEALPVLADELVATVPAANRATAMRARDTFYTDTVRQMHAYANGSGDVPSIVKRSGKSTSDGVRYGRAEMSYFLGIAYLEGVTVQRDATEAVRWLERAATMGNRGAQAKLGAFR
jgi:TPR repeat protein